MKVIIFEHSDGSIATTNPQEGARLAFSITLADGAVLPVGADKHPVRVDTILRGWPVIGATANWAETEDELAAKIAAKDIPVTVTDAPDIVRQKMGKDLAPDQRAPDMMLRAVALRYGIAFVETPFQIIDEAAVPQDWTFRNAWKAVGLDVQIDMPKAREIHKNKLRELRAPQLAALDVEYYRADEAGDAALKKQIVARKQALRDATADPRIAAATTPEQLKAVIPDVLT